MTVTKSILRQQLRQIRNNLSDIDRQNAASQVCNQLLALAEFQQATTIAAYMPIHQELDPTSIIQSCWGNAKKVTLPTVHADGTLSFCVYEPNTPMQMNQFGILEVKSDIGVTVPINEHDIILIPMLGFDADCNRIGMGAGYYDKTFAHIDSISVKLIAIGYECQCVKSIAIDPWDIKMDKIITEKTIYARK